MKKLFHICLLLLCQLVAIAQDGNTKHTISIVANPTGSCYISINSYSISTYEVEVGKQVTISISPMQGYALDSLTTSDVVLNYTYENNPRYRWITMPDHDVTITALLHYAPELPPNPNETGWDAQTGTIIANNFAPGGLQNTLYDLFYNRDTYETDYSKVKAITAIGEIDMNDWFIAYDSRYKNLAYFDISRTTGLTELRPVKLWNNEDSNNTLTTLLLPATITQIIGNEFFLGTCIGYFKALRNLTCYATTPPTVTDGGLKGLPTELEVYVPAESLPLYAEAEGWKDLNLLPITQGVHSLTVNLPASTDMKQYKDMYLELANTQTGQTRRYVMTTRQQYTFTNLIEGTQYNIYIRNAREDILGCIMAIDINKQDVQVSFTDLKQPRDITLQLTAPDGTNATDGATVIWTDALGNYLQTGATLSGQMDGARVIARVKLDETLGKQYRQPTDTLITVGQMSTVNCQLTAIPQAELSGTVTATATERPIRGAVVTVVQQLNGLYPITQNTITDAEGRFMLTAYDAPTTVTMQATGYVPQTVTLESLPLGERLEGALADLTGTTVRLDLTYRPAVEAGEDLTSDDTFSDYDNISYTVYDETHRQEITEFTVDYPRLVLQGRDLAQGTKLRVTATSLAGLFMPTATTCTVNADGETTATLILTQKGQLNASFSQTDNTDVVGMLYDGNGQLQGSYHYDEAQLGITGIDDGQYTLITMGESQLFNSVNSLAALTEMRLEEGRDYVKNKISIQSGHIESLHNDRIPMFDESVFYYTGDNTSFTANKTQVTVGNYITLKAQVDFKSSYTPEEVQLMFDLPDGCSLVEGSVMAGNKLCQYQVDGNRVTIPLTNFSDQVRFCIVPTKEGYYEPTASVSLATRWSAYTQPLGSVAFTAEALSINVPQQTASSLLPVGGMALANATVQVYDNGVLIGQTQAGPAGNWQTMCQLSNAYNLSSHPLYAVITTSDGLRIETQRSAVTVSHGTLTPVVNMTFSSEGGHPDKVTWDFRSNTVTPSAYWARYANGMLPVSFDIDLMDDDEVANDTLQVTNVKLYVLFEDYTYLTLYPRYNSKKGCWHAAYYYNEVSTMPINVAVDFTQNETVKADRRQMDDMMADVEGEMKESRQELLDVYRIFDSEYEPEHKAELQELETLLQIEDPDDDTEKRIDELTRTVVGDSIMDAALERARIDFTEYDRLMSQNPDLDTMERAHQLLTNQYAEWEAKCGQPLNIDSLLNELDKAFDEIDRNNRIMRDSLLSVMSIAYIPDTATFQKPDGDIDIVVQEGDGYKHIIIKKLASIDTDQLLKDGYIEMPTTDGNNVYCLYSGRKTCYVDTKDAKFYSIEILDDESLARYIRKREETNEPMDENPNVDPVTVGLKIFPIDCLDTFKNKICSDAENLGQDIGVLSADLGNIPAWLKLLQDGVGTFLDGVETIGCLYDFGRGQLDKVVKALQANKLMKARKDRDQAIALEKQLKDELARERANLRARTSVRSKFSEEISNFQTQLAKATTDKEKNRLTGMIRSRQEQIASIDQANKLSRKAIGRLPRQISKAGDKVLRARAALDAVKGKIAQVMAKIEEKLPIKFDVFKKIQNKWFGWMSNSPISAIVKAIPLGFTAYSCGEDFNKWVKLYTKVQGKIPCEGNEEEAQQLLHDCGQFLIVHGSSNALQIVADFGSYGLSLVPSVPLISVNWWASKILDVFSFVFSQWQPAASQNDRNAIQARYDALQCGKKKKDKDKDKPVKVDDPKKPSDPNKPNSSKWNSNMNSKPVRDPSGFVYEAVSSNRLEGVKTTCFYKEEVEDMYGDLYENVVVWDAENYAQENPLFTDADGKYAWDVPQGLWQVKYEKEGYETTYSEWLPVPPPQLEVNVGMRQLRQPVVQSVKACTDGIDITFDKYMDPATLTTKNIFVTKGGQTVGGKIELLNADCGYQTPDQQYASKIRFVPATPLTLTDKVQLTIRRTVESYAGLQMEQDYTQPFDVEQRLTAIIADTLVYIAEGSEQTITVSITPAAAAKGKTLQVIGSDNNIVSYQTGELTLDANGQVSIVVTAIVPGSSSIRFNLTDDDELTATTTIIVRNSVSTTVADPKASRMSGTEVYRGAEIKLTCQTAGATILYTLDGSCPCDAQNTNVLTYTGPITATGSELTIKAMAVANGMGESDVAEFHYKVIDNVVAVEPMHKSESSMQNTAVYYRLDGSRTAKPQKGLNIMQYEDGTVRKVVVK